jgi:vitamin B12 transporter
MRKFLVFFCLSLFCGREALAASEILLEDVVISANKIETPATQAGNSVSVVSGEELAATGSDTLEEAVTFLPGVYSVTPGTVNPNRTRIRGAHQRYTQVRLDDFPLRDPSELQGDFSAFHNSILPMAGGIERIEVLKGAQSTLYGSSALGGVINIFTGNKWESGAHADFRGSFGTYGESNLGANLALGDETYYLSLSGRGIQSDGFLDIWNKRNNLTLGAGVRFSERNSLEFTVNHVYYKTSYFDSPEWDAVAGKIHPQQPGDGYNETDYNLLGLTFSQGLDAAGDLRLKAAYGKSERDYFSWGALSAYEGTDYYAELLYSVKPVSFFTLVAGAEYEGLKAEYNAWTAVDNKKFNTGAFFAKGILSLLDERLNLDLGGRYNRYDHFGGKVVYSAGAAYSFDFGLRLYANTGSGYRAPSAYELYGYDWMGIRIGNPDLDPESTVSYEAGLEQNLRDDKLTLGVAAFKTDFKDMIDYDSALGTPYHNVDKARSRGLEFSLRARPHEIVELRLSYTALKAEEKDLAGSWADTKYTPQNFLGGTAILHPARGLTLGLIGRWQDKAHIALYDPAAYSNRNMKESGFFTLDLAANYDFYEHFSVFGKINNLLDKDYTLDAYSMPGITGSLGVRIGF